MAFGKDDGNKNRLQGTLSQRAAYARKQDSGRREGGGGKGKQYWMDNFHPSETPDTIRCIYGEYPVQEIDESSGDLMESTLPYFPIIEHYHGGLKKGALCSAGPYHMNKLKRSPCEGCDMFWQDYEERAQKSRELGQKVQNPKRISKSNKFVLTILDPGDFFETEQLDRTGQVKLNAQGKPWMNWRKLRYPNDPAAVGRQIKQGMVQPWSLNRTHFDLLQAYSDSNIGMCCSGCGTWGHAMSPMLQTLSYNCQNCRTKVIDMKTSTLAPNQIKEIINHPVQCQSCGTRNFVEEVIHCPSCQQKGTTAKRASLWDVDIQVQITKSIDDPNKQTLIINGYTAPMAISPQFVDIAKPLDLPAIFKPTPLEEQRLLWGIAQTQAAPHAQPYSRP
jgi:hypothetical protein